MIGIYKILSPSGKVYIGQSWNIEKRFNRYRLLRCKKQRKLYCSLLSHGAENHIFTIIHELPIDITQRVLDDYEILYWKQYIDAGYEMLNLKYPGSGGRHSQESINMMKEKSYLKGRKGSLHPAFGKKLTLEHIEKIMSKRRGKDHPLFGKPMQGGLVEYNKNKRPENDPTSKRVIDITTGEIYYSASSASKKMNIHPSTLSTWLNGHNTNKSNLKWLSEFNNSPL